MGVVLVRSDLLLNSTLGMAYTPLAMVRVMKGSMAPMAA